MPRKDLTLSNKIDLLNKIKNQPPNTSQRTLEKVTGVPKSTISRLLKNEEALRGEWALGGSPTSRKRKREGKEQAVEEALKEWFAKCDVDDVSGAILKAKAEDLAEMLGRDKFKATDGWLSRWKSRHGIKLKKKKRKCRSSVELLKQFAEDVCNGLHDHKIPDGAVQSSETLHRGKSASYILKGVEENQLEGSSKADEWPELRQRSIQNRFASCGRKNTRQTKTQTGRIDETMQSVEINEKFISADNNSECYKKKEEIQQVTHEVAKKYIDGLRLYFMQAGNEGSPVSALNECDHFVQCQFIKRTRPSHRI